MLHPAISSITYEITVKNLRNLVIINLFARPTASQYNLFNAAENRVEFTVASLPANVTQTLTLVVNVGNGITIGPVIENKNITAFDWTIDGGSFGYYPPSGVGTVVQAPSTLVAVYEDEGIEAEEFNITMNLIFPDGDTHVYTDTVLQNPSIIVSSWPA